jgi:hypothetical protein
MRCTTARFGSLKKDYCFLHLLHAVCRNSKGHCQEHLSFLRSPAVPECSSRIFVYVLLLVLTMLHVIFVDCVQTAHSVSWNLQIALPWTLSLWNTGSGQSRSSRGLRWKALLGLGLVIPSTFTGTQLEARAVWSTTQTPSASQAFWEVSSTRFKNKINASEPWNNLEITYCLKHCCKTF